MAKNMVRKHVAPSVGSWKNTIETMAQKGPLRSSVLAGYRQHPGLQQRLRDKCWVPERRHETPQCCCGFQKRLVMHVGL